MHLDARWLDIEKIRQRPGMYVVNTGQAGVCHLIFGLVEEFIDVRSKVDVSITITLADDDSLVFTCDRMIDTGNSLGIAVAKALSDVFDLSCANKGRDAIKILFRPDKTIFTYDRIDYYRLYNRFKELSQLNANVRFFLSDSSNKNLIHYPDGLNALLYENMYEVSLVNDPQPMNLFFTEGDFEVSLAMLSGCPADAALSYVNNARTHGGGTHVQGLYDGVYASFQKYIETFEGKNIEFSHKEYLETLEGKKIKFSKQDLIDDLNFVISVRTRNPLYGGSTKRTLSDQNARTAVKNGVERSLNTIMESDRSFFDASGIIQFAALIHTIKSAMKKDNPEIEWDE